MTITMSSSLPKPVSSLMDAREALRRRWNKAAAHGTVSWTPDVVDVRSEDIDQVVRFAQDVHKLVAGAKLYDRLRTDMGYQMIFMSNLLDQVNRLAATHFRD